MAGSIVANAQQKEIVFATYTYSVNNRIQNLEPLTQYLSTKTGLNIKAVSYPTVQALISAIVHDSADFAMMNTTGYLVLQRNHPYKVKPLVNLYMGNDTATNYGGCMIALKQSPFQSIKDLSNTGNKVSLALVNPSSTVGNLVPRLLLNSEGIADAEKQFDVYYTGTHKKVVEDVLNGKAAIGGCGCAEVDSARLHMNFDEKAVVIASYNNTPLGPVVSNAGTDKKIVSKITALLLSLHKENYPVLENFCRGWSEFIGAKQFKKVNDAAYNPFRKMFGNNKKLWKLIE